MVKKNWKKIILILVIVIIVYVFFLILLACGFELIRDKPTENQQYMINIMNELKNGEDKIVFSKIFAFEFDYVYFTPYKYFTSEELKEKTGIEYDLPVPTENSRFILTILFVKNNEVIYECWYFPVEISFSPLDQIIYKEDAIFNGSCDKYGYCNLTLIQ